jgi:hypothetical protein
MCTLKGFKKKKKNQSKMDWMCGSVVECLLCKCKALSSDSSPTQKQQQQKPMERKAHQYQIKL